MRRTDIAVAVALAFGLWGAGCSSEEEKGKAEAKPHMKGESAEKPMEKAVEKPAEKKEEGGWIGVKHQTADAATVKKVGKPGTQVVDVTSGGPGAKAGLKAGDVIISFEGKAVKSDQELDDLVRSAGAGKKTTVVVMRGKAKKTLTLVTAGRP